MSNNKYMDSGFLNNSRWVDTAAYGVSQTVHWDLRPGYVNYNYVVPSGSTQHSGSWTHKGIWRDGAYQGYRHNLFEGIKCVKFSYRKNYGAWTTKTNYGGLSDNELQLAFSSSHNGDIFEVQATYEAWIQGSPYRSKPFFYFTTNNKSHESKWLCEYRFAGSKPDTPTKEWSGFCDYQYSKNGGSDRNASWSLLDITWTQPNSSSITSNWSYIDAKNTNSWDYGICQKYYSWMGNDGWVNYDGRQPMLHRKSMWWRFSRTFSSSYQIVAKDPPVTNNPGVWLGVYDNRYNTGDNNQYNGEYGKIGFKYTQPQGKSGRVEVYGYQNINGNILKKTIAIENMWNGQTIYKNVYFGSSGFQRSHPIYYHATSVTWDDYYKCDRTGRSDNVNHWDVNTWWLSNGLGNKGVHYYNEEPWYPASIWTDNATNNYEGIGLHWNGVSDPDGDQVIYTILVCREESWRNDKHVGLRVANGSGGWYDKTVYYSEAYDTTNTWLWLPNNGRWIGENITIYVRTRDKYTTSYWYANSHWLQIKKQVNATVTAYNNLTTTQDNNKKYGYKGQIKINYSNNKGNRGKVYVYAYGVWQNNATCPAILLGKVLEEDLWPGDHWRTIDFRKINNFQRGMYISYYALAYDTDGAWSQNNFNEWDAWWQSSSYQYFNKIPTAVTPFVTEDKNAAFNDEVLELAWPTSQNDDNTWYTLYVSCPNKNNKNVTTYNSEWDGGTNRAYHKKIDLGYGIVPTSNNPYRLNVSEYLGNEISLWITTSDDYNEDKYLTGNELKPGAVVSNPEVPTIKVEDDWDTDLYGDWKISGEKGKVNIAYTHKANRPGNITLHGICNRMGNNLSELNEENYQAFGFGRDIWNNWVDVVYCISNPGRDTSLNFHGMEAHKTTGGKKIAINFTGGSNAKKNGEYATINVGVWGKLSNGENFFLWPYGFKADAAVSWNTVRGEVTLPNDAVSFGVFLQHDYNDHSHSAGEGWTFVKDLSVGYVELKLVKNITTIRLESGQSETVNVNFNNVFGNDWDGSKIRYYAVATSEGGGCSDRNEIYDWHYYNWQGGEHRFNAEPLAGTLTYNEDIKLTNLHNNVHLQWNEAQDIERDPIYYGIALSIDEDRRQTIQYCDNNHNFSNKDISWYAGDTNSVEFDLNLKDVREGADFSVWITPHDDYANEHYHSSNILTFTKAIYGIPDADVELTQNHSEWGHIKIKTKHEDVVLDKNGNFVSSKDKYRPNKEDYVLQVELFCYCDGVYNKCDQEHSEMVYVGDTLEYDIDLRKISTYKRSSEIRYFVRVRDVESNKYNYAVEPGQVDEHILTAQMHYLNDEPGNPIIGDDYLDDYENRFIYRYDYTILSWPRLIEPDGDKIVYYAYVKVPESLKEASKTKTFNSYDNSTDTGLLEHTFTYNRCYRITEEYDDRGKVTGSTCHIWSDKSNSFELYAHNDVAGLRINYLEDALGKEWPENEEFTVYIEARDDRPWDNSYYGYGEFTFHRKAHIPPNEVKLTIIPNLIDDGNGEHGKINILYTHEEGMDGWIDVYAYQDDEYVGQVIDHLRVPDDVETLAIVEFPNYDFLKRSNEIQYFAKATDVIAGLTSFDKEQLTPETIPAIKLHREHYYNEEPTATSPEVYDDSLIPYFTTEIKWPESTDPDGHDVQYDIYVGLPKDPTLNTNLKEFYNDEMEAAANIPHVYDNDAYVELLEHKMAASGTMNYNKVVNIASNVASEASKHFSLDTHEYPDDSILDIWIESKDKYINSYYRTQNILELKKGHAARPLRDIYPCNGSIVYDSTPRILLNLGIDDLIQTVYVYWNGKTYDNKKYPQYFSDVPNTKNVVVFQPPEPATEVSGTKVTYYAYVHNQCTYSEKKYATFTYVNYFEDLTNDKLIPIRAFHSNHFRNCVNNLRYAYGLENYIYSNEIRKDAILDNIDFNEVKNAILEINTLLNDADPTPNLDYNNNLIIDVNDLDLIGYEGQIGTASYQEFIEWARLVYLLENM